MNRSQYRGDIPPSGTSQQSSSHILDKDQGSDVGATYWLSGKKDTSNTWLSPQILGNFYSCTIYSIIYSTCVKLKARGPNPAPRRFWSGRHINLGSQKMSAYLLFFKFLSLFCYFIRRFWRFLWCFCHFFQRFFNLFLAIFFYDGYQTSLLTFLRLYVNCQL